MPTSDNPVFSEEATHAEKAEANRIAASLEAKPKMSRAESKRRKAIKSQPPLANPAAPLAKVPTAPPSAKAADEESARLLFVASVQKAAEEISAEFAGFVNASLRVEEVKADLKAAITSKITFKKKFTSDKHFVENCRLVRTFFSTRRLHESLTGFAVDEKHHLIRYTTAKDYFNGECNVSYEYIRKLGEEVSEVGKLLLVAASPKPPKEKKTAVYDEAVKHGEIADKRIAEKQAEEAAAVLRREAEAEEVPVSVPVTVNDAYAAIVAFAINAASKLPLYDKLELSSRLSEYFAKALTIQDTHTITITPEVEA